MKNKLANTLELASTHYFHLNKKGELVLNSGVVDRIIDCHTHLGLSYFLGKKVDLTASATKVELLFPQKTAQINLQLHTSANYTDQLKKQLRIEAKRSLFGSSGLNHQVTVARLEHELKLLHVTKAFVLAIDLPILSHNSENMLAATKSNKQLLGFASVHPLSTHKSTKIISFKKNGAIGIKLHPTFMGIRPSHKSYFEIYDICQEFGLPILFHTGYGSLIPKWSRYLVAPSDFDFVCKQFPRLKIIFGHGGGQCLYEEMAMLANKHSQTFLQYDGLPATVLKKMLKKVDTNRVLIGSDWPMYPLALQYIRGFIATENNQELRDKLFFKNAELLLANLD